MHSCLDVSCLLARHGHHPGPFSQSNVTSRGKKSVNRRGRRYKYHPALVFTTTVANSDRVAPTKDTIPGHLGTMGSYLIKTFIISMCYHVLLASAWYVDSPPNKKNNNFERMHFLDVEMFDLTYFLCLLSRSANNFLMTGPKVNYRHTATSTDRTDGQQNICILCLLVNN